MGVESELSHPQVEGRLNHGKETVEVEVMVEIMVVEVVVHPDMTAVEVLVNLLIPMMNATNVEKEVITHMTVVVVVAGWLNSVLL